MTCPFVSGGKLPAELFIGRQRELRRTLDALYGHGQSVALVGERGSGRSSLLAALHHHGLARAEADSRPRLHFSVPDVHLLDGAFTHAAFWTQVLRPLEQSAASAAFQSSLARAWLACVAGQLRPSALDAFFDVMRQEGVRLIVLLDEVETLLHHPMPDPAGFFASFRSLFSRNQDCLRLVITSRLPLETLEEHAMRIVHRGSPYFNFLSELVLGPFSDRDLDALLARGGENFRLEHRDFVKDISGSYPWLAQETALELWQLREDGIEAPLERAAQAREAVLRCAARLLHDAWELWSSHTRKVFVSVAHGQMRASGEQDDFLKPLLPAWQPPPLDLELYHSELTQLKQRGMLEPDAQLSSGWRVRARALLWAAADLLARSRRPNETYEAWLQAPVPPPPTAQPLRVFISYAHADETHREQLQKHLIMLQREAMLETWDDRCVAAGEAWEGQLHARLATSDLVLLLVSSDFNASRYAYDIEMQRAMERHAASETRVVPIIVRPCDWSGAPYGGLQALPQNGRAISLWGDEDEAWSEVARHLRRLAQELRARSALQARERRTA